MRGTVRTLLAAAAGATLVASFATVVRLSDEAVAATASPVAADTDTVARAGLVPSLPVDDAFPAPGEPAPAEPAPVEPAPAAVPPAPEPAAVPRPAPVAEPGRAPATARRAAPARPAEPAAPAPRRAPAEAPVQAPAAAPDEPVRDTPVRDEPDDEDPPGDGQTGDGQTGGGQADEPATGQREPDRPGSLLGGVTEPLGVSCGGLLGAVCG